MPYPPDYQNATWFFANTSKSAYAMYPSLGGTLNGPFTLALWMRVEGVDASGNNQVVSLWNGSKSLELLTCTSYLSRTFLEVNWARGTIQLDLPLATWVHVAVTFDGTTTRIYFNGAPRISAATDAYSGNRQFVLGANSTQPPNGTPPGLYGGIRSFGYWPAALTSSQIVTQMWSTGPAVSGAQIFTDFTQSPPKVSAGPPPVLTNSSFLMDSYGLWSDGVDVAAPGFASTLNPSAAAPFSLIAWVAAGEFQSGTPARGCFFSNGDASERGSMAVWFNNGVPTVTFDNGPTVTANVTVFEGSWNSIAVTYDGVTCTIYVNGTASGSAAIAKTALPMPLPRLMGQSKSGAVVNPFLGLLQFLSVWDVALTAAEVTEWLNDDPSAEPNCVADFAAASNPPQDLVPIAQNAIWDENLIGFGKSMQWRATNRIRPAGPPTTSTSAQNRPATRPVPIARARRRPSADVPFGSGHREKMRSDFNRALSSIESPELQQRMRADFERDLDETFDRVAAGEFRFPGLCRALPDGDGYVLTFDSGGTTTTIARVSVEPAGTAEKPLHRLTFTFPDGRVSRMEVEMPASCVMWWVGFILSLVSGAFMILALPTPQDRFTAIAQEIVEDAELMSALSTIEGSVGVALFTPITIICFLRLLYDYGYLTKFVNAVISKLGWWGATYILAFIVFLCAPIPNPEQALFIAEAVVLAAELAVMLVDYPSQCGSESPMLAPAAG